MNTSPEGAVVSDTWLFGRADVRVFRSTGAECLLCSVIGFSRSDGCIPDRRQPPDWPASSADLISGEGFRGCFDSGSGFRFGSSSGMGVLGIPFGCCTFCAGTRGARRLDSSVAMYLPKSFEPPDADTLQQFLRAHSFGALVTGDESGLDGNGRPFVFNPEPSPYGTLRGHVARANPIWRECEAGADALASSRGPTASSRPRGIQPSRKPEPSSRRGITSSCTHTGPYSVVQDAGLVACARRSADQSS